MISLLRSIVAVILGYAVFAVSSGAIFLLSGHPAHAPASMAFMLMTIVAGIVFAAVGGYVAGWLAGRRPVTHALAVGVLLAVGAAVSLAMTLGHGAVWTQIAALLLMAPSAVAGGWWRAQALSRAT